MEQSMTVCGKAYRIIRLLGHGKGGYSYLAEGEGGKAVPLGQVFCDGGAPGGPDPAYRCGRQPGGKYGFSHRGRQAFGRFEGERRSKAGGYQRAYRYDT